MRAIGHIGRENRTKEQRLPENQLIQTATEFSSKTETCNSNFSIYINPNQVLPNPRLLHFVSILTCFINQIIWAIIQRDTNLIVTTARMANVQNSINVTPFIFHTNLTPIFIRMQGLKPNMQYLWHSNTWTLTQRKRDKEAEREKYREVDRGGGRAWQWLAVADRGGRPWWRPCVAVARGGWQR